MFILVRGAASRVPEKCRGAPVSEGIGDGLVYCGAECGRVGRGNPHCVDQSSAGETIGNYEQQTM